jgi:hypothetical protein
MWHQALPIPEGLAFNDWYFNVMMARRCEFYYVDRVLADYRVHASNHHMRVVRDRTEESSILSLLDRVFSEVESSKDLEDSKRKAKSRVYARQYLTLADKYFGMDMYSDARRCYWASLKTRPSYLLDAVVQRRLAATIIGRGSYELSKRVVKGILVPSSR